MSNPTETEPWSDERIDKMVADQKQCADVLAKIGEALKDIPVESREKIIRAVAILYDIELPRGSRA